MLDGLGEPALDQFVNFWRRCDLSTAPYAHPEDWPILRSGNGRYVDEVPNDFDGFVRSTRFGDFSDSRFHLSLLPSPYAGNLGRADIVLLLLNPGFGYTDYYGEYRVEAFRKRFQKNLMQDFVGCDFPFLWLDPDLCWHGGFRWWEQKLREVVSIIAREKFKGSYLAALRDLSGRLAHVELVAYHSPTFKGHRLIEDLPSVRAARKFAREYLAPKADGEGAVIIVTRQDGAWGLPPESRNVVRYRGWETRGANLGAKSAGGRAILNRYGI